MVNIFKTEDDRHLCRVRNCNKSFKTTQSRRNHERKTHSLDKVGKITDFIDTECIEKEQPQPVEEINITEDYGVPDIKITQDTTIRKEETSHMDLFSKMNMIKDVCNDLVSKPKPEQKPEPVKPQPKPEPVKPKPEPKKTKRPPPRPVSLTDEKMKLLEELFKLHMKHKDILQVDNEENQLLNELSKMTTQELRYKLMRIRLLLNGGSNSNTENLTDGFLGIINNVISYGLFGNDTEKRQSFIEDMTKSIDGDMKLKNGMNDLVGEFYQEDEGNSYFSMGLSLVVHTYNNYRINIRKFFNSSTSKKQEPEEEEEEEEEEEKPKPRNDKKPIELEPKEEKPKPRNDKKPIELEPKETEQKKVKGENSIDFEIQKTVRKSRKSPVE
jgi:hypothetical protein